MKLSQKIWILVLCASLASAVFIALSGYTGIQKRLLDGQIDRIGNFQAERARDFSEEMARIEQDLRFHGGSLFTRMALQDFAIAFNTLALSDHGHGKQKLHGLYAKDSVSRDKSALDDAKDGSLYSQLHRKYHPSFRGFARERGYPDLLLISPDGDVLYSIAKRDEFTSNLDRGQWKESELASLFRQARDSGKAGEVFFSLVTKDELWERLPGAFVATPVVNDNGTLAGVLALRLPVERLAGQILASSGEGKGVRTHLVSADFSVSRGEGVNKALFRWQQGAETEPDRLALEGRHGAVRYSDKNGESLLAVYRVLHFRNWHWGIVSVIQSSDLVSGGGMLRNRMLITLLLTQLVVGFLCFTYIRRHIARPLGGLASYMSRLSKGDKSFLLPPVTRQDEIGEMTRALQLFKENAIRAEILAVQHRKEPAPQAAQDERQEDLLGAFDHRASRSLLTVSTAARQMSVAAAAMVDVASKSNGKSGALTDSIGQMSSSVKAVALASGGLTSAIDQISTQVLRSTNISQEAVEKTRNADVTVQELSRSAQKIGDVVSLISDIADQINLLALNATIESARAGEAGKGFAVVASEVKTLASQTSKATEDIGAQIAGIQNVALEVVRVITEIRTTISQMSDVSSGIASAVKEQGLATQEIARNIHAAEEGVSEVSNEISEVRHQSMETDRAARQVLEVAGLFSKQAESLKGQVETFIAQMRGQKAC